MDPTALQLFLEASVRLATPLALAALGESIAERSGVLNIGLEGSIVAGALAGAMGSLWLGDAGWGVLAGALAGGLLSALFAFFAIALNGDAIISGTAITLLGLGATGVVYQGVFGATGTALTIPTLAPWEIPLLSSIPLIGGALFGQAPTAYLAFLLAPLLWLFLFRTAIGRELRAAGEEPDAAAAAGVRVRMLRAGATVFGGVLGGIAGAHLALAHAGTFTQGMSAGRGFIAIAVVVLGRWNPVGVLLAALFFGSASALQFLLQAFDVEIPYPVVLMIPYLLTLLALGGWVGRARAPAALALPWPRNPE